MDATISTAARATLEAAINRALVYDPATLLALKKLEGQVLAISISFPATTLYLAPSASGIRLLGQFEGDANTHLKGSIVSLLKLATGKRHSFAGSGVEVLGNTALLIELNKIFAQLDIDWEEALSQWLGDTVGPLGASFLRKSFQFSKNEVSAGTRLASEFLTEEYRAIVGKYELDIFYSDVRATQLATDRLSARITKLARTLHDDTQGNHAR